MAKIMMVTNDLSSGRKLRKVFKKTSYRKKNGGWVGGWMGGDQKGPSIWLKIEYNNKQGALIPNMALKVVYGY